MVLVRWKIRSLPKTIFNYFRRLIEKFKISIKSFTYNDLLDQSYVADVCMEPLFWFVDNFMYLMGPIFVAGTVLTTTSIVCIAYWLGLPYWWARNQHVTILLLIIGHWLLVNVIFHYYMAVTTPPGYPPEGELITEAVSICRKCIQPKPPRTHHCNVCNRCVLKMDHHCPMLNNCVGHYNHRYFFLYTIYLLLGVLFLIVFGWELGWDLIWSEDVEEDIELEGHPVRFNKTGALIALTEAVLPDYATTPVASTVTVARGESNTFRRRVIIYMALICFGVLFAMGALVSWHSRLIGRGETCIESHINRAETKRLSAISRTYINPYDLGGRNNWRVFLGLVHGRSWLFHVLLPSAHRPPGNGLTWHTIDQQNTLNNWP